MKSLAAAALAATLCATAAHAQSLHAVRPVPGYVCMLLADDSSDKDAPMPPILAEPSTSAQTLVLTGAIVFVKSPPHNVNGYLEVLTINRQTGWFPADALKPYRSVSDPNARCVPSLMSSGQVGIGRG